jgi:hypothetical protein
MMEFKIEPPVNYVQQYQETGSHIDRMDMKMSPKTVLNYQNTGRKLVVHLMKRGTDKRKTQASRPNTWREGE